MVEAYSPMNSFVTGFGSGINIANVMMDLRKKADDLEWTQLQRDIAKKKAAAEPPPGSTTPGQPTVEKDQPPGTTEPGTGDFPGATSASGLGPSDTYHYLVGIGASPNEATVLTSAVGAESSFRPDISHDGGIGYGLFGHNGDRLAAMRNQFGKGNISWQNQLKFALDELRGRPEGRNINDLTTPEQLTDVQMQFERPKRTPETNDGNYAGRLATTRLYMQKPPPLPGMTPDQVAVKPPSGRSASAAGPGGGDFPGETGVPGVPSGGSPVVAMPNLVPGGALAPSAPSSAAPVVPAVPSPTPVPAPQAAAPALPPLPLPPDYVVPTPSAPAAPASSQKAQYDADVAAGRRPVFAPGQRFNSRGEAISADLPLSPDEAARTEQSTQAIRRGGGWGPVLGPRAGYQPPPAEGGTYAYLPPAAAVVAPAIGPQALVVPITRDTALFRGVT